MPSGETDPLTLRVLVIAPDQARLDAATRRLTALGFPCAPCLSSPASLHAALLDAPDVVAAIEVAGSWQPVRRLLEVELSQRRLAVPPVLVIGDDVSPAERAAALDADGSGVWDWVGAACPDVELSARLTRLARLRRLTGEIDDLRRRCAELDTVDRLTGLPNHRAFQEFLDAEFRRAERYEAPLSLVLLDIDRFRSLNDTHGYPWGDRLLRGVAAGLRSIVREVDMAARFGGEEFALLLPETDAKAAQVVAGRARAAIEQVGQRLWSEARLSSETRGALVPEGPSRVTASAGVATWPDEGTATRGLLLAGAEAALRRAKDEGRNRTVAHAAGAPAAPRATPPAAAPDSKVRAATGWSTGWHE